MLAFSLSSKAAVVLTIEIVVGLFVIIVTTFFLASLTKDTLFDNELLRFDTDISRYIYAFRTPFLTQIFFFVSQLGAELILTLSTLIVIFFSWKKHKTESLLFSIMLVFGALLNLLLKDIFQRPRPTLDPLFTLSSYSFPSGHAMNSFVFYATLSYFFYHFTRNKRFSLIVACLAGLLVLLIGVSRIYLGVHYPSDVLAGYLAGLLWFVLVLVLDRTLRFFRLYKNYISLKELGAKALRT